jgi:hypothetical protein
MTVRNLSGQLLYGGEMPGEHKGHARTHSNQETNQEPHFIALMPVLAYCTIFFYKWVESVYGSRLERNFLAPRADGNFRTMHINTLFLTQERILAIPTVDARCLGKLKDITRRKQRQTPTFSARRAEHLGFGKRAGNTGLADEQCLHMKIVR